MRILGNPSSSLMTVMRLAHRGPCGVQDVWVNTIQDLHKTSLYNAIFQWKSNRNEVSKVSRCVWVKCVVVTELLMKQPS